MRAACMVMLVLVHRDMKRFPEYRTRRVRWSVHMGL